MNLLNEEMLKTVSNLAETYPDDQGIRMIVELVRWVEEQCYRHAAADVAIPG